MPAEVAVDAGKANCHGAVRRYVQIPASDEYARGMGDDRNGDGRRITSSRLAGMPRAAPIAGVALAR